MYVREKPQVNLGKLWRSTLIVVRGRVVDARIYMRTSYKH